MRKKDISKEISNSNLLQNEIIKNENLINQIDIIMQSSKENFSKKIIDSGSFKNNAKLISTLQSQKDIAFNRNNYLKVEKELTLKKIKINNLKKIKAEQKVSEYRNKHFNELEKKNFQ